MLPPYVYLTTKFGHNTENMFIKKKLESMLTKKYNVFPDRGFITEFTVDQGWGRLLWKVIDYDYNYMAFKK